MHEQFSRSIGSPLLILPNKSNEEVAEMIVEKKLMHLAESDDISMLVSRVVLRCISRRMTQ